MLLRNLLDPRDQLKILPEIVSLKPRVHSPEIVLREIVDALDLARKESTPERTVRHEADIEEPQRVEQPFFGITSP